MVGCCWMLAGIGTGCVVLSSEVVVVTGIVVYFDLLHERHPCTRKHSMLCHLEEVWGSLGLCDVLKKPLQVSTDMSSCHCV